MGTVYKHIRYKSPSSGFKSLQGDINVPLLGACISRVEERAFLITRAENLKVWGIHLSKTKARKTKGIYYKFTFFFFFTTHILGCNNQSGALRNPDYKSVFLGEQKSAPVADRVPCNLMCGRITGHNELLRSPFSPTEFHPNCHVLPTPAAPPPA